MKEPMTKTEFSIRTLLVALCGLSIGLQLAGCSGITVAGYIGKVDNEASTAANVATSRSAATSIPGASNTVDAVEIEGSGGIDATIPLGGADAATELLPVATNALTSITPEG